MHANFESVQFLEKWIVSKFFKTFEKFKETPRKLKFWNLQKWSIFQLCYVLLRMLYADHFWKNAFKKKNYVVQNLWRIREKQTHFAKVFFKKFANITNFSVNVSTTYFVCWSILKQCKLSKNAPFPSYTNFLKSLRKL